MGLLHLPTLLKPFSKKFENLSTARLWSFLPVEYFPLTYDLNGFKFSKHLLPLVLCNRLFHQPLFLYFSTLGIEIWFKQEKCSFVEKNSFASFATLFEISRRHRERLCQKFNIVRYLPNSAQWFNGYVEGSSILKIKYIFPLTFLQLVNSSKK